MRYFHLILALVFASVVAPAQKVLSLDSCRSMALRNNKEIKAAQVQQEIASYQRQQAHAAYLPSVDFQGTYIYNSKKISMVEKDEMLPTKSFNPATGGYDYNLVVNPETGQPLVVNGTPVPSTVALLPKSALTYNIHSVFAGAITITHPIYMGGKIKAMNEITRYAEELARLARDRKAEDLIYEVDAAYWQVVSLRAKQELAKSYVELVEALDRDVAKMLEQGVATKSTLLSVDVKVNEAHVDLTRVNNGVVLARMLLAQLCGMPINEQFELADEGSDDLMTTLNPAHVDMNEVYSRRADVNSLVLATKIYDEKAKVARAEMMPTVAAIGAAHTSNPNMYNGFKNRFGFGFSIGAIVKIPLWHWGGLSNKYKEAKAEARLKQLELDNAKEKIELQVRQASFRYDEAYKTYEATNANLNEANENLRVAQIGFKEGVATADDVLTAQTAWLKAHSEKVDAEIDVRLCDVYLSKVLGTMKY